MATFKDESKAAADAIKALQARTGGEATGGQIEAIAHQHFDAINDDELFAGFLADVKAAVKFKEPPAIKE